MLCLLWGFRVLLCLLLCLVFACCYVCRLRVCFPLSAILQHSAFPLGTDPIVSDAHWQGMLRWAEGRWPCHLTLNVSAVEAEGGVEYDSNYLFYVSLNIEFVDRFPVQSPHVTVCYTATFKSLQQLFRLSVVLNVNSRRRFLFSAISRYYK